MVCVLMCLITEAACSQDVLWASLLAVHRELWPATPPSCQSGDSELSSLIRSRTSSLGYWLLLSALPSEEMPNLMEEETLAWWCVAMHIHFLPHQAPIKFCGWTLWPWSLWCGFCSVCLFTTRGPQPGVFSLTCWFELRSPQRAHT